MEIVDGAVVYKARDSIEARALAAYLENADIPTHVTGEVIANVFGVQNIGGASGAEVWVNRSDRAAAEELIRSWQSEYGGDGPAGEPESLQYPLKAVFVVTAIVAVILATSNLFGGALHGFVASATMWFWILLIGASVWAVYFRKPGAGQLATSQPEEETRKSP